MFSAALSDRLEALIDDLILDGSIEAASLASILLAARDSLRADNLLTLSCLVWNANNALKANTHPEFALAGPNESLTSARNSRRPS